MTWQKYVLTNQQLIIMACISIFVIASTMMLIVELVNRWPM